MAFPVLDYSAWETKSKEAGKLMSQQCWEQEISAGYHMEVVQKAKMPLHNYVLYMYNDTDRRLYNGPNLPSLKSDALKLCSLCQPGLLHPSSEVICKSRRGHWYLFTLKRMMQGEGWNWMSTTISTSASAGLYYALSSLLEILSLPVLWLGHHGRSAVKVPAEIQSFVLPRPLQPKNLGIT